MEIDRIKHLAGMTLQEGKASEYEDSAEFTDEMVTTFGAIEKFSKLFQSKKWKNWMKATDENYSTTCVSLNDRLITKFKEAANLAQQLEDMLMSAE